MRDKCVFCISLLCGSSLIGCSSKQDANADNFLAALQKDKSISTDVCLGDDGDSFPNWFAAPVDGGHYKELVALRDAGLVAQSKGMFELTQFGRTFIRRVKDKKTEAVLLRYTKYTDEKGALRDGVLEQLKDKLKNAKTKEEMTGSLLQIAEIIEGNQLVQDLLENKRSIYVDDICYAQLVPSKVVKWEGPMQRGNHLVADVTFRREIISPSEWTKNAAIISAFGAKFMRDRELSNKELVQTLKQTSQGWENVDI